MLKAELEAIQDGVRAPTPDNIKSLQAEVERLGKLVTDLHDLSLADVGGLAYHFEDLDLAQLVREALDGARERLAARDLDARDERSPPHRSGCAPIRNASSSTIANLRGKLGSLHRSRRQGARDAFAQRCPLRPPRLGRLRARRAAGGARAASSSASIASKARAAAEAGGSGLGLAICQSIAQAHGGAIEARASKLGGLWIELRFPNAKVGQV